MPSFEHDGVLLDFDDTPASDPVPGAPTLVLLHGIANSRGSWEDVLPALTQHHRAVRLDLRGHGAWGRAPGRYAVSDYAEDVIGLLDALDLDRPALVGHSLGGLTAAWLAAHRPELVRGIALVDPPLFSTGPVDAADSPYPAVMAQRRTDAVIWQEAEATVEEVAAALAAEPSVLGGSNGDHWSAAYLARLARARLDNDPATFDPLLERRLAPDWYPDEATIACPVLVVAADPALGAAIAPTHADRLTRLAPHAELLTYTGTSHMVHIDAPDRFTADLLAFIARLGG